VFCYKESKQISDKIEESVHDFIQMTTLAGLLIC